MIYYLHPCARTSASWLNDSLVSKSMLISFRTLSYASQLVRLEQGKFLPMQGLTQIDSFYLNWCLTSVWHTQWLMTYHESLCEIHTKVLRFKHNNWSLLKELNDTLENFPNNPFVQPRDPEIEREQYAKQQKFGTYRRVAVPFWMKNRRVSAPIPSFEEDLPLDSEL